MSDADGVPKQIDDSWDNDETIEMPRIDEGFHISKKAWICVGSAIVFLLVLLIVLLCMD